jgi:hypothetical protein
METRTPRYAVYFVPAQETKLYRFGSAVLAYDCYSGQAVQPPAEFGADPDGWRAATEEPRRYGFHATLKAPFHLASSCTEQQLISAFQSFAALGRGRVTVEPVVEMLGDFAAIVPGRREPAADALAADCTTIFDAFRAPMAAHERARRLASGLSHSQLQNLDRWGYPYLFADFRFHMTLTGRIAPERREQTLSVLRQVLRRLCGSQSLPIDRLALVKQDDEAARFRVLSSAELQG